MCTSMRVPCNSLRGSMAKGSLASLVGQALWGGERGVVSKNHGKSSGSNSRGVCTCLGPFYPEQRPCSSTPDPRQLGLQFRFLCQSAPPASHR